MKITILDRHVDKHNRFNHSFEFNADQYDVHIIPDYKTYGNGIIDISKIYPQIIYLDYCEELLSIDYRVRPHRFWFGNRNTSIFDEDGDKIDNVEFCATSSDFHIISIEVACHRYKIKCNTLRDKKYIHRSDIIKMVVGYN